MVEFVDVSAISLNSAMTFSIGTTTSTRNNNLRFIGMRDGAHPAIVSTTWFLREGFDWGVAELKLRFENAKLELRL